MNLVIRDNVERAQRASLDDVAEYLLMEAEHSIYGLSIGDIHHVLSAKESGIVRVQSQYSPLIGVSDLGRAYDSGYRSSHASRGQRLEGGRVRESAPHPER